MTARFAAIALVVVAAVAAQVRGGEAVVQQIYTLPFEGQVSGFCGFGCYQGHQGVDYFLGSHDQGGHPILAGSRGTVKVCPFDDRAGNYVVISHGNGHITRYLHLSSIVAGSNQTVARGQVIGYEGDTGDADGPHLHFETRHGATTFTCAFDGTAVDPYYSGTYMWITNPPSMRPADFGGGGGCADVVARNTSGALEGFWGNCSGGFGTVAAPIISGWSGYTWLLEPGDSSGDGCADVLARNSSGYLYSFAGNCAGGLASSGSLVSSGWNRYDWQVAPGDFSGDGCPDVLARTSSGNLYGFWGNCAGSFSTWGQSISGGWQYFTWVLGPGDFNGDGCADVLGRSSSGNLYGNWGNCAGNFSAYWSLISSGWNSYNRLVAPGDFSGGGCPDVLARTSSGNLYGFWGDCSGGFGTWGQSVGGGFQGYNWMLP